MKNLIVRTALSALLLCGCSVERTFYFPNTHLYSDPHDRGYDYEIVRFPSFNGAELTALHFKTYESPKGIVVYLHGNFGNVSNHYPQAMFLLKEGFDLLLPDYQGFGGSDGTPSPRRTVEDGRAAVRYAASVSRVSGGVMLFGQSLGAAVAAVVAAEEPQVRAVVLESPFSTYRAIARDVLRRSFLTWPFAWILPPVLVRRRFDPVDFVGRIAPRPLLMIHGTGDKTVPFWMSERVFKKAREPKRLWLVPGAGHLDIRRVAGKDYEKAIADFFLAATDTGSGSPDTPAADLSGE